MQDSRVDLPAGSGLELVRFGMVQNAVVAFIPALQAAAHIVARGAGFKAHERVGKIVFLEVVLRREVVGLRFRVAIDAAGIGFALMHVMRYGPKVVEELTEQVPAAALLHHVGAKEVVAGGFDRFFKKDTLAIEIDVAETFVCGGERTVVGARGGGEPALIDASTMGSTGVEVAGVEFEAASRHEEGSGDPAGGKSDDAFALL